MRRTPANSSRGLEPVITWALVALLHIVVAWILTRPVFIGRSDVGPSLQVVFLQRLDAKPQPVAKVAGAVAAQGRRAEPRSRSPSSVGKVNQEVPRSSPTLVVGDDTWDRPATIPPDAIIFADQPLASTYNPRPRPAPGRFRMRRQVSPEDVVRGVSQVLGFWPPGYTDDPCAGLDKAVEVFSQGRTRREQGLLVDALRERDKYCK